jgi:MFS family permease
MSAPARRPRFFLGWTVVVVAAFVAFSEVAFFNPVLGVFIPEFEREFGWSRTQISSAVTLGSLAGALMAPFFGPLIDRHGGKRFVAGGCTVMAIALVCLSLMETEWQFFIIYTVGRGMAAGMIGLAASVTVSKWFIRRRGFAVGVTSLGTRVGFAVMPIGVQLIIDAQGWRLACLVLASLVASFGILPALRWLHSRPEAFGLQPDGDLHAPVVVNPGAVADVAVTPLEYNWSRHDAVRTRAFWLVTLAISLQNWAGGAVNLHQIPHLVDQGLSPESAAWIISLVAVFAAGGALFEGILDTRIGARRTMVVGLLGSACGMLVLINVTSVESGLLFAATYGVAFGLMVTSSQIVFADYFGRHSLGAIRGSAAPFQMVFNAIGPIVGGVAYDQTGSYLAAFIPFTCAYVLAAGALVIARRPSPPSRVEVLIREAAG